MNSIDFALNSHPIISEFGLHSVDKDVYQIYPLGESFRIIKGTIKKIEFISGLYLNVVVHNERYPNIEYTFYHQSSSKEVYFYKSKSDARRRKY